MLYIGVYIDEWICQTLGFLLKKIDLYYNLTLLIIIYYTAVLVIFLHFYTLSNGKVLLIFFNTETYYLNFCTILVNFTFI